MKQYLDAALVISAMLVGGYIIIGILVMCVGMLAGLLVRPAARLTSKMMTMIGIQWTFRPYRRVLVLDGDVAYESREIWDRAPDDWMDFSDEWLIGTIAAAVTWPYLVYRFVSWPIRRFVKA
jgi:hypothetical protein